MNELSSFSSATVKTIRATTATTGAGSKRAAGEAIDADRPTWELKKPSKKIATAADSKEPATEDQHFFRFLDLSPELRNRVAQIHEYEDTTTESQPALDLLEQWGIFDLIVKKCTVFVMAYEDEQITERNGRKITNSVVREVRVYKVATKHQAASSI
ncbi:unnamed protein product [Alternaria alternata]